MPWLNFCKKCNAEVPLGESCSHCGGKLSKTNERLSFGCVRAPVKSWFCWNSILRVALPVLLLVALVTLLLEGVFSGGQGVRLLFLQGFLSTVLGVLGMMLLFIWLLLGIQGRESVHYVIDKSGVFAYTYLDKPTAVKLSARFLSREGVEKLRGDEQAVSGFLLVRKEFLAWADVRRVRCWRENCQLLFFRPRWWQALSITCPPSEYAEAEAFVRKKLGRSKQVQVLPIEKKKRG